MASQQKENWWRNTPDLTRAMDLMIPSLEKLARNPEMKNQYKQELDYVCGFLAEHPLAIKHNKNKRAILEHLKMNIDLFAQGKPFHH